MRTKMAMDSSSPHCPDAAASGWRAWLSGQRSRLLFVAFFALFLVYGSFRQRYIWGVDSFGYFQLGKLFSEGRVFLPLPYASPHATALVPWGFTLVPGTEHARPDYPPGFPLLLGIGHWLGAPLWVTPFCGMLSGVLLLGLLRTRVSEAVALLMTAAWAVMPLTVYGSTMVMSDLVAATTLLGGLWAFRRGRPALAGWLFVLSVAVRPTDALFLLPFSLTLRAERATLRLFVHLAVAGLLYAAYNTALFGAPWRTGYGNVWGSMSPKVFPEFAGFFLATTWKLLTPVVILFAAVALLRPSRERAFLALWPLTLIVFYSFWESGGADKWWWLRFILPGLPMVFLLAAEGCELSREWLAARVGRPTVWRVATLVVLALPPFFYLRFGLSQDDLWKRDIGRVNYDMVLRVEADLPPGALVGTLEHASSLALYTQLTPFVPVDPRAADLVAEALEQGRRVFLLPEPWQRENPYVASIFRRFAAREVARYDSPWHDLVLYELSRR